MSRRLTQKPIPRIDDEPRIDDVPVLVSEKIIAKRFGLSLSYLRKSRSEGVRFGRTPPPPYIRVEGRIFYSLEDVNEWYAGLPRFRSLAEEGVDDE
jgi:hypothetical protein